MLNPAEPVKFTQPLVEQAIAQARATGERVEYRDTEVTGLRLRVGNRSASWCMLRRINGESVRVTICDVGAMTLKDVRAQALQHNGKAAAGVNPNEEKRERVKEARVAATKFMKLGTALDTFLAAYAGKQSSKDKYKADIHNHLADWLDTPLDEITRPMVSERYNKLQRRGHTIGGAVFRAVGLVINWHQRVYVDADDTPLLRRNPIRVLPKGWSDTQVRSIFVTQELMGKWANAVGAQAPHWQPFFWILLFTGMRRNEVLSLHWSQVDLEAATIALIKGTTKNGRPLLQPIPDFLVQMLARRFEYEREPAGYVWPVPERYKSSGRPYSNSPRNELANIERAIGVRITAHPLRRTFSVYAGEAGIPDGMVRALMNQAPKRGDTLHKNYRPDVPAHRRRAINEVAALILRDSGLAAPPPKGRPRLEVVATAA